VDAQPLADEIAFVFGFRIIMLICAPASLWQVPQSRG
jgi:hypothetical protein